VQVCVRGTCASWRGATFPLQYVLPFRRAPRAEQAGEQV